MRRSRFVKLTILPALATACATAPISDEERIDRAMRGDSYNRELGVAFEGENPRYEPLPDGEEDDALRDDGYASRSHGFGGGGFWTGGVRGGFGGFFSHGFGG